MRLIRPALLVAAVSLAFAPGAQADHVSAAPTASAHLGEELSDNAWEVIVDWAVNCSGASDPNYFGTLNLVDADTGERMYQGGISGASGTDRYPVERRATVRTVYPEIQA